MAWALPWDLDVVRVHHLPETAATLHAASPGGSGSPRTVIRFPAPPWRAASCGKARCLTNGSPECSQDGSQSRPRGRPHASSFKQKASIGPASPVPRALSTASLPVQARSTPWAWQAGGSAASAVDSRRRAWRTNAGGASSCRTASMSLPTRTVLDRTSAKADHSALWLRLKSTSGQAGSQGLPPAAISKCSDCGAAPSHKPSRRRKPAWLRRKRRRSLSRGNATQRIRSSLSSKSQSSASRAASSCKPDQQAHSTRTPSSLRR